MQFFRLYSHFWRGRLLPAKSASWAVMDGRINPLNRTFAWQAKYMEGLGDNFAYSLSYLNQGHFIEHHRDGYAANLWVRKNLLDRQLSLAAGFGGLFYFDTIHPADGGTSQDFHGWGTMTNVAATWYTESRLFYELQGYWVRGGQSFDTLSALAGIGYQLDAPPSKGPDVKGIHQADGTTDNEMTLFGGQTIVNIPGRRAFARLPPSNTGAVSGATWSGRQESFTRGKAP